MTYWTYFTMPMYICLITMLAEVFHPLQLTINSMKLTLHCIFSHINNTYTIEFPLEHADGMYHSENHWQLPHVNISYILFTNREKDGIPLNQHCSSQCKWEHSHILYLPEVQCMCSLFFFFYRISVFKLKADYTVAWYVGFCPGLPALKLPQDTKIRAVYATVLTSEGSLPRLYIPF